MYVTDRGLASRLYNIQITKYINKPKQPEHQKKLKWVES